MANTSKGLGKGLAALLGDDVIQAQEEKSSLYLPISQVESCASQPRKQFDPESLSDLADSIREHGIIQPLTVRKLPVRLLSDHRGRTPLARGADGGAERGAGYRHRSRRPQGDGAGDD